MDTDTLERPAAVEGAKDMIALVTATPALVLTDPKSEAALIKHIKGVIKDFVPDLTTVRGRQAIGGLALKISKTKTAVEEAGAKMTEEARATVTRINTDRNRIKAALEELRDLARKPLDDWEEIEAKRVEGCEAIISRIRQLAVVAIGTTSAQVEHRIAELSALEFRQEDFRDLFQVASALRAATVAELKDVYASLKASETEKAELETLRKQAVEQATKDAAAQAAREKEAWDAKVAQDAAAAKERLDAEKRIAQAEKTATVAIEEAAQLKTETIIRDGQAKLAAEEDAQRANDAGHRKAVLVEVIAAIRAYTKVDQQVAGTLALAIAARQIPHVTLKF